MNSTEKTGGPLDELRPKARRLLRDVQAILLSRGFAREQALLTALIVDLITDTHPRPEKSQVLEHDVELAGVSA